MPPDDERQPQSATTVIAWSQRRHLLWLWIAFLGSVAVAALALRLGLPWPVALPALLVIWLPLILPVSLLQRLPARRLFLHAAIPRIEISRADLALFDGNGAVLRLVWDDIEALEVDQWCRGRLVGRGGITLGYLSASGVRPQRGWWRMPSLAVYVIRTRPDLFTGVASGNRFTQPYAFRRRMPDEHDIDLGAIERRQNLLQAGCVALMVIVLTLVVVLFPHGLPRT